MGISEDTTAALLHQIAEDLRAGRVVVWTETRKGCGAGGCEAEDKVLVVHHVHVPPKAEKTEEEAA